MIKELLPHVFNKPIAFHRILAEVAGSVNGGVFLSQAMYWSNIKTAQDGWFYKTVEDWEGETFLSRREQETVRRNLIKIGILEEKRAGIPARLYFRVKTDALLKKLTDIAHTRTSETATHDTTKETHSSGGKGASNTETTTEITTEITKDIYLEGFEEFWQAYPKRPGNSRKDALKAYTKACHKLKVPHQDIMAGVKAYAAFREGEPPQYTKTAAAWLNGWMWESDWTVSGNKPEPKAVKPEAPAASDTDLDAIVSKYPGVVSDRAEARKILGSELSKGTELKAIVEAAEKYKLYIREMKQNDVPIAPSILETWLKFKWRDMDAYFIFKSVTQPYPTLKPVSEKPKWWGKL